jgi:hypothetical protein
MALEREEAHGRRQLATRRRVIIVRRVSLRIVEEP